MAATRLVDGRPNNNLVPALVLVSRRANNDLVLVPVLVSPGWTPDEALERGLAAAVVDTLPLLVAPTGQGSTSSLTVSSTHREAEIEKAPAYFCTPPRLARPRLRLLCLVIFHLPRIGLHQNRQRSPSFASPPLSSY